MISLIISLQSNLLEILTSIHKHSIENLFEILTSVLKDNIDD